MSKRGRSIYKNVNEDLLKKNNTKRGEAL